MISSNQVKFFAKKFNANESTILREYLQIFFLNELYKQKNSAKVYFKGGTAIHLLFGAPRFSEDLDFTVMLSEAIFMQLINSVFSEVSKNEEISFKQRRTIAGKTFLLTAKPGILPYATFINLDFSFREKVIQPEKSTIDTPYPILFNSFIYHLSLEEMCAEKIRAIFTRQKGRDFYDLWFLISKGVSINNELVEEKLQHYKITVSQFKSLLDKTKNFSKKDFILDIRPFVPINQRDKLGEQFDYIKSYLVNKLSGAFLKSK